MTPFIHHFIGSARTLDTVERWGPVYNPSTGDETAAVPFASGAEVDAAVRCAGEAFEKWSATPALQRARVMFRFRDLLESHTAELAELISSEHGKVLEDAKGEVRRGLEVVEFCCGIPHLMKGEFSDSVGRGIDSWSLRQPLGVCAGVTPFNFPVMVPLWMLAPAIACGNAFILKPSEKDPSAPVRMAELLLEAGAPPGVLNVVHGDSVTVDAIVEHPAIEAVSFVGSTPIARRIYQHSATYGKRVQAMGGAKNHLVVMGDADIDQAVEGLMGAAYGSAGERCMAVSVAVAVGKDTADQLVTRLAARVKDLAIGPSLQDGIEMGPLVTREHVERVRSYIDLGVAEGASLVVDGRLSPFSAEAAGFFLGASLFDHVTSAMRIYQDEIFGPVLCVVRVSSADEALRLANDHVFGNGVSIYTRSGQVAREFTSRVRAGMVGVNVAIPVPMAFYSFGGWKQSAFGDLNQHGEEGVRFYTRLKNVTARWPVGTAGDDGFAMPVVR